MDNMNLMQCQIDILEESFRKGNKLPDGALLTLIAAECGLTEEQAKKWFKLRYAQWRQSEGLPAKLGSVLD